MLFSKVGHFSFCQENNFFYFYDFSMKFKIYFADLNRSLLYVNGLQKRLLTLERQYMFDKVNFDEELIFRLWS